MRIGVMRCERDGAAHCRCAVVETPAVMQRRAEIGPCVGKVGSQFDCVTVSIDGVIEPSQCVQRIAEIAVRFGKIGLGRDGLAVSAGGFAKLPHLVERDTEIAPCFGIVRPKLDCAVGGGDRVLRPSGEAEHLAEIAVIERDARVGSDGALHEIDRVRQLPFLMRDDPKEVKRRRVIRARAQHLVAQRLGRRQSACLQMLLGAGERIIEAQRHGLGAVRVAASADRADTNVAHLFVSSRKFHNLNGIIRSLTRNIMLRVSNRRSKSELPEKVCRLSVCVTAKQQIREIRCNASFQRQTPARHMIGSNTSMQRRVELNSCGNTTCLRGVAVERRYWRGTLLATSSALAMIVAAGQSAEAQCALNNNAGGSNNAGAINCISYNNGVNNTGDIVNQGSGTITPTHTYAPTLPGTATGISVVGLHTTLTGNITNSGTITNTLGNWGINIGSGAYSGGLISSNGASLNGSITNIGTITAHTGIQIQRSTMSGSIVNSTNAHINSTGNVGISAAQASIGGGITNSGTISGGLSVSESTVAGTVSNGGTINAPTAFAGLTVVNGGIVGGSVINSGNITAQADAIEVFPNPNASGAILNQTITGSIINTSTGTLSALVGIALTATSNTSRNIVGGNIINNGTITAGSSGIGVYSSTVAGSISNTGTISGGVGGIVLVNYTGGNAGQASVGGSIVNSNSITGTAAGFAGIMLRRRLGFAECHQRPRRHHHSQWRRRHPSHQCDFLLSPCWAVHCWRQHRQSGYDHCGDRHHGDRRQHGDGRHHQQRQHCWFDLGHRRQRRRGGDDDQSASRHDRRRHPAVVARRYRECRRRRDQRQYG